MALHLLMTGYIYYYCYSNIYIYIRESTVYIGGSANGSKPSRLEYGFGMIWGSSGRILPLLTTGPSDLSSDNSWEAMWGKPCQWSLVEPCVAGLSFESFNFQTILASLALFLSLPMSNCSAWAY